MSDERLPAVFIDARPQWVGKNTFDDCLEDLQAIFRRIADRGFLIVGDVKVTRQRDGKIFEHKIDYSLAQPTHFRLIIQPVVKSIVKGETMEIETARIREPVPDGITRDGSVCTFCGATAFERRGTCLYCIACGTSVGGCS
jgi:hypothetical protein